MYKKIFIVFLLGIFGCGDKSTESRVIVISSRGFSDSAVDAYLDDNIFDTNGIFGYIDENGYRAEYLNPIPAAETLPAMASFETGAYPSTHGIVSNVFHLKGSNISEPKYAYSSQFESESIWEAAARQGKKVIRIGSIFEHGYRKSPEGVNTISQAFSHSLMITFEILFVALGIISIMIMALWNHYSKKEKQLEI